MNGKIRINLSVYLVTGIFSALVLCALIALLRYKPELQDSVQSLERARTSIAMMKGALPGLEASVNGIKKALPRDFGASSPEELIMEGLDSLKARMPEAEIRVSNIEDRGNEVGVDVGIKATMSDYTAFVNNLGYLQAMSFPFFRIKSISVMRVQEREDSQVHYSIEGVLRTPKKRIRAPFPGVAAAPPAEEIRIIQRQRHDEKGLTNPIKTAKKKTFPQVPLAQMAPPPSAAAPQPPVKMERKVSLILVRGNVKSAIINGIVVKEGDRIDNSVVAKIEKNRVLIKAKTGEEWIGLE